MTMKKHNSIQVAEPLNHFYKKFVCELENKNKSFRGMRGKVMKKSEQKKSRAAACQSATNFG